ncbi:TPA: hypothetical protein BOS_17842 [Bos taurus]|nr:TPA: hypothetical protein BOS_17842 [Bos taurus]
MPRPAGASGCPAPRPWRAPPLAAGVSYPGGLGTLQQRLAGQGAQGGCPRLALLHQGPEALADGAQAALGTLAGPSLVDGQALLQVVSVAEQPLAQLAQVGGHAGPQLLGGLAQHGLHLASAFTSFMVSSISALGAKRAGMERRAQVIPEAAQRLLPRLAVLPPGLLGSQGLLGPQLSLHIRLASCTQQVHRGLPPPKFHPSPRKSFNPRFSYVPPLLTLPLPILGRLSSCSREPTFLSKRNAPAPHPSRSSPLPLVSSAQAFVLVRAASDQTASFASGVE